MPPHVDRLDIKDIALGRRSAAVQAWAVTAAEPLSREDLVLLAGPHAVNDPKAPLARISAPHHMLARLIAQGKTPVEVSAVTGYSTDRIRTLQIDPSFSELVAHYETEHIQATADIQAQIQHIALTAGQNIQERLDETPETFTNKELRELWAQGLDRSGHGPKGTMNVNINDPSHVIANLNNLLSSENRGRVLSRAAIDAEFTEVPSDKATSSSGAQVSEAGTAGAVPESAEVERPGSGGPKVSGESA